MIILLLFLYSFSGHIIHGAQIDFISKKPVICSFYGNKFDSTNPLFPVTDPSAIPSQCEVILFNNCKALPTLSCNTDILKAVVALNRPVILRFIREVDTWSSVLTPDGNAEDAKAITDYVKANGATGVLIGGLTPESTPDGTIATNFAPYIKHLKSDPNFIVGVTLDPYDNLLTDPCVFNYEASNDLLDFYVIWTQGLNGACDVNVFNGLSPIHPVGDLLSLESVTETVKTTKIAVDKIYYVIDLMAIDISRTEFVSYSEVCTTQSSSAQWCIPTTKDYFDKATYIHDQNYGILVYWIEYDDSQNCCGCNAFVGFLNVIAGYKGENQLPCAKFDIKASP